MFGLAYTLDLLCLIVVIGSIIFFILYRKIQYTIYDKIDAEHQTQDDYTIFVENIPILDFDKVHLRSSNKGVQFEYDRDLKAIFEA